MAKPKVGQSFEFRVGNDTKWGKVIAVGMNGTDISVQLPDGSITQHDGGGICRLHDDLFVGDAH